MPLGYTTAHGGISGLLALRSGLYLSGLTAFTKWLTSVIFHKRTLPCFVTLTAYIL